MYYDYQKVLSYNALFNFIIGERGVGKTYGAKKICIKDFLKNGNQFVYIRRYKTELDESLKGFFDGLLANEEFGEHQFKIKKGKNSSIFECDGKVMGYGLCLSTAVILKSREFPLVNNIIFDEFIIDKGSYHYLQNEVHAFLDIYETLARLRDVRVFLLGNAVSRTNPYFLYFNIDLPYGNDIRTFKDNTILINYIKNLAYREKKKSTRFGRLIDGTEYGNYAIDNKWLHENKVFVGKRPDSAKFFFIMIFGETKYGVWSDHKDGKIYISNSYDPSCPIEYVLDKNDHTQNTTLVAARSSGFFKQILEHYRNGLLYFESIKIKQMVLPAINKYIN